MEPQQPQKKDEPTPEYQHFTPAVNEGQAVIGGSKKRSTMIQGLAILILVVAVGVGLYYYKTQSSTTKNTPVATQKPNTNTSLTPNSQPPADVSITSSGFSPSTIQIKTNQAVTWTNNDSISHFVLSDNTNNNESTGKLNSKTAIGPALTFSYVFKTPGSYSYHDSVNPKFVGVVIVK